MPLCAWHVSPGLASMAQRQQPPQRGPSVAPAAVRSPVLFVAPSPASSPPPASWPPPPPLLAAAGGV